MKTTGRGQDLVAEMRRVRGWAFAALVLVGCGAPPVTSAPVGASHPVEAAARPASGPRLSGTLRLAPGTPKMRGRLALAWIEAADADAAREGRTSMAGLRRMLPRWVPGAEVELTPDQDVAYAVDGAPPDAAAVVVLDVDHRYLETLFGIGPGAYGVGPSGGGAVVLSPTAPATSSERCAGDRMQLVVVPAPETVGRIGHPPQRRFCAWLPESYSRAPARRYPVVWMLGGLTSTETSRLLGKQHAGTAMDAIAKAAGREAIVIGVDTSSRLGSSYMQDSSLNGAFDAFFTRAASVLDQKLRTIPKRSARAIVGQSTGGLDTLSFGMRHPELFSALGASSPDPPNLETWLFEPGTRKPHEWIVRWARFEDAMGSSGQLASYAAAWSPDESKRGYAWPFDLDTGALDEKVFRRWLDKSPSAMLHDPKTRELLQHDLRGRIMILVGKNDEFGLFEPAKRISEELEEAGLDPQFVATEDGHGNSPARIAKGLEFVVGRLDHAN